MNKQPFQQIFVLHLIPAYFIRQSKVGQFEKS